MATKLTVTYENHTQEAFDSWSDYAALPPTKLAQIVRLLIENATTGKVSLHERCADNNWRMVR